MRTQLLPVRSEVPQSDFPIAYVENFLLRICQVIFTALGTHLGRFPMEMHHAGASCPFVQIVDILGDDRHFKTVFQRSNGTMGGIG